MKNIITIDNIDGCKLLDDNSIDMVVTSPPYDDIRKYKNNELKQTNKIKPVPDFSPRNNIWKYIVGKGFVSTDAIAHKHPAIFPEKLAEDHILTWSNENDIILDPFMGSGTTAKMSLLNNRRFIGFDNSDEYVKISKERINNVKKGNMINE